MRSETPRFSTQCGRLRSRVPALALTHFQSMGVEEKDNIRISAKRHMNTNHTVREAQVKIAMLSDD